MQWPDSGAPSASQRTALAVAIVLALLLVVASAALGTGSEAVRFPPPGSCHVRGSVPSLYVLPDRHCTPGALNPDVTQETIRGTICTRGWARTVRPPEAVTEPQKRSAIRAYGAYAGRRLRAYEFDHLIPLELGGAPDAAANLWPEPDYPSVIAGHRSYYLNPKDRVESRLRRMVCSGALSLAAARQAIAGDWVAARARYG